MKTTLLFCVILIVSVQLAFSQQSTPYGTLPNYDPPSPEAASLGKFVDHPVGNFTGTSEIDIPLFEIKAGRIVVPISLSYHGSGVKVNDVASRAGAGWVLNAGGVITRTVKGYPDNVSANGSGSTTEVCYFQNNGAQSSMTYDPNHAMTTVYDLEPDEFFYNFGNKKGKMFFRDATHAVLVNDDPLIVSGPFSGNNTFTVTDEKGIVYTFQNTETTTNTNWGMTYSYVSSWFLTKISDPVTGEVVNFQYTNNTTHLNYSYIKSISDFLPCTNSENYALTNDIIDNSQVLSQITYNEGYVQFTAGLSRSDLTGDNAYTQISQYINTSGTTQLLKGYNLSYTYTNTGSGKQEGYRLYLNSVQEFGSDNSLLPPYQFSYKNSGASAMPDRNSPQQDIWGYYNANGTTTTDPPQLPQVYVHTRGNRTDYLPFNDNNNVDQPSVVSGVNYSTNTSTVDAGTLSKIIYPTQGYTTYSYESNQFTALGFNYTGGGIRIKEVDDYSSTGQLLASKTYQYSGGFLGGPLPQVAYPIVSSSGTPNGIVRFTLNQTVLGSSQGSYVGYQQVTVNDMGTDGSNNGSTVYTYTTDSDAPGTITLNSGCEFTGPNVSTETYYPFFEMESRAERRGKPSQIAYYDPQGNIRKSVTYGYQLATVPLISVTSNFTSIANAGPEYFFSVNISQTRNINMDKMLMTSKSESDYDGSLPTHVGSPSITNVTNYTYCGGNNNDQFLRSESRFSSGMVADPNNPGNYIPDQETQTKYTYPFDYSSNASGGVMQAMVSKNYISPVISEIKLLYKNLSSHTATAYYTGGKITDYMQNVNSITGAIVPKQVFSANLPAPLQAGNSAIEVADPSNPGSLYEKRIQYLNYDSRSNPTLMQSDNLSKILSWSIFNQLITDVNTDNPNNNTFPYPPQSWNLQNDPGALTGGEDYVWGGRNTAFPFNIDGTTATTVSFWAKGGTVTISNPGDGYDGIPITVNVTAPANWQYYSYALPTLGRGYLGTSVYLTGTATISNVSISSGNSQLTSYSYDNWSRLQSVVDPGGKIRSFEYDPFNRLINIRDNNGNLLSHTDYHNANQ